MITSDFHEPADILRFISPVMECDTTDLNLRGIADYYWSGEAVTDAPTGEYQLERKTWYDLIGSWDEVEDLLRRQHQAYPHFKHRLLVEGGGIEPAPMGVYVYKRKSGSNVLTGTIEGKQRGLYDKIMGGLAEISDYIQVYYSLSYASTASMLIDLYRHDQKTEEEHTTFRRHAKIITWHPNAQVIKLMGAASNDSEIGPSKAEELIRVYGTAWAVMAADPRDVAAKVKGVSESGIKKLMRNFGRLDV